MAIKSSFSSGSRTVDKVIGTNYQVVKKVKDRLPLIESISDDLVNLANRYYGELPSTPVTRLDGTAIQPGDMFKLASDGVVYMYSGSAWADANLITVTATELSAAQLAAAQAAQAKTEMLTTLATIQGKSDDVTNAKDVTVTKATEVATHATAIAQSVTDVGNTATLATISKNTALKSATAASTYATKAAKERLVIANAASAVVKAQKSINLLVAQANADHAAARDINEDTLAHIDTINSLLAALTDIKATVNSKATAVNLQATTVNTDKQIVIAAKNSVTASKTAIDLSAAQVTAAANSTSNILAQAQINATALINTLTTLKNDTLNSMSGTEERINTSEEVVVNKALEVLSNVQVMQGILSSTNDSLAAAIAAKTLAEAKVDSIATQFAQMATAVVDVQNLILSKHTGD